MDKKRQNTKPERRQNDKIFRRVSLALLKTIPPYNSDLDLLADRLNRAVEFRNALILSMSAKAVDGFIARISTETLSNQIWKTACNLTYGTILEELPASDKLKGLKEQFTEEEDSEESDSEEETQ